MRVGSGVILFQLAGFLTSALADFYFAKHTERQRIKASNIPLLFKRAKTHPIKYDKIPEIIISNNIK